MRENISYFAYLVGWKIVGILPESTAYRLFQNIADIVYRKNGKSVRRLRANLAIVKPHLSQSELEALTQAGYRSYLRYWCDTFRIHKWSPERISKSVSTNRDDLLRQPMAENRGVIIALPHSGNWDHAGAYFCAKGIRLVTVAERLKPEKLFLKFLAYRQAMGMEVLPLDGRVLNTLQERLNQGALVALVSDRDLSRSGIEVDFFDGIARMPAGPALLALRTKAPLITAFVSYTDNGVHIEFRKITVPSSGDESSKVKEIVQSTAQNFENGISENPEDWHMLQRIWIDGDFKERA